MTKSADVSQITDGAARCFVSIFVVHVEAAGSGGAASYWLWSGCLMAISCRHCIRGCFTCQTTAFLTLSV